MERHPFPWIISIIFLSLVFWYYDKPEPEFLCDYPVWEFTELLESLGLCLSQNLDFFFFFRHYLKKNIFSISLFLFWDLNNINARPLVIVPQVSEAPLFCFCLFFILFSSLLYRLNSTQQSSSSLTLSSVFSFQLSSLSNICFILVTVIFSSKISILVLHSF